MSSWSVFGEPSLLLLRVERGSHCCSVCVFSFSLMRFSVSLVVADFVLHGLKVGAVVSFVSGSGVSMCDE
jgi:hypothetical protein